MVAVSRDGGDDDDRVTTSVKMPSDAVC